jgi:DNA sulfur modification protein DndB
MWDEAALTNVAPREDLIGLAREKARRYQQQSVPIKDLDDFLAKGWGLKKKRVRTATVTRDKQSGADLEDRVWTLLYRMGFPNLSGAKGALLTLNPDASHTVTSQIDVLAIDDEVCLAVECKSMAERGKRAGFQQELAKHALIRERLNKAVNPPGSLNKRAVILAYWTHNALLSRNDKQRAKEANVLLLDEGDLGYYETLTQHVGPAARYQLLADLVPGKPIPGLSIRVPALRAKMGGFTCYTFSIAPEYLLKIAYVSHRARGKRSDVATYQRMVSKSRLKKIARYISGTDALFPTNIVINLEEGEKGRRGSGLQFDRAKQEGDGKGSAVFGWLTLRPAYKSAWIIDGQHRLYAYSGHPRAATSSLSVLAFEGLPGNVQQKLFIDINAEQKSVKPSLLQELYADLHRGSDDPRKRMQALISEAIQEMNADPDSPFFDRVLRADTQRTDTRCISLTSLFGALDRQGFYFGSAKQNVVIDPGPFWADSDDEIIKRTTAIVDAWFEMVRQRVPEWWDIGAGEGGGLAMNDGVTVCLSVLRSVVDHLDSGKGSLADHSVSEVVERLEPYGTALGEHFAAMSTEQRAAFRSALRGTQGQTAGMRHAQQHIQTKFPDFQPDGLQDFLERESARTNDQAMSIVNDIERVLSRAVVSVLKEHFGTDGERWWWEGVPKGVRGPATQLQDDDKNQRGSREAYLTLIHYRTIVLQNWPLFDSLLGRGKRNWSKDRRTEWMVQVNEIRKLAAHPSSQASVSFEQLAELREYLEWLQAQVSGEPDSSEGTGDEA